MFIDRFVRALADLIWSFFPIFALVFVLSLFGEADRIASRSDLVLTAGVLFAEGWWKTRSIHIFRISKATYEMVGVIGALVAVLIATVMMLAEVGNNPQLILITSTERFSSIRLYVEIAALIFAIAVRMKIFNQIDQNLHTSYRESVLREYMEARLLEAGVKIPSVDKLIELRQAEIISKYEHK